MSAKPEARAKPAAAERRKSGGLGSRVRAWREQHLYSLVSSLGRLAARPFATGLTVGVMAIALALPLGLGLALGNIERFSGSVTESREIGVFLKHDVTVAQARDLATGIGARADVAGVSVRTPDEGLAEFRAMSDLAGALDVLEENPLPTVLVVQPKGDGDSLAADLRQLPQAEIVQHDAAWRQRLSAWLAFGERVVQVVAVLLGLGVLLVVGNTVRLDIGARSEEIAVLQHLGATDAFVRRPFLYLGAWYGLAAGVLAGALLLGAGLLMQGRLSALVASYGTQFALSGPGLRGSLMLLAGSALMGWLGAWLATGHHLRRTRPVDV
ncbi:MAG TPA: permease-like cell division protein FtsX [Arenimonas sp.]|mgnify:CR=1 FL=1|nr:permease-like cell division protein FtsX [Arenimonas sp.]